MNLFTKQNVAKALVMAFGLGLGFGQVAEAQQAPAQQVQRQAAPNQVGAQQYWDAHFAFCLVLANQNEIAMARIADQKSSNPKVKEFAEMMLKDHQKFMTDLERFGGRELQGRLAASPSSGTNKPATTATQAAPAAQSGDFHMQLKRELADQCLASAQKELSSKSGAEFDKCYIGMQLGAHMHMIDELKVLEHHSSANFQALLKQGEETTEHHLQKAKDIMKSLEGEHPKTASKS